METVIDKLESGDILKVTRLLKGSNAILANNVTREILDHISNGVALKLVVDGKIEGIWCSKDTGEYISLSYFYISTSMRRTFGVLELFKTGLSLVDINKPLLIETADTTGFDKYFDHVENNVYVFKGFR